MHLTNIPQYQYDNSVDYNIMILGKMKIIKYLGYTTIDRIAISRYKVKHHAVKKDEVKHQSQNMSVIIYYYI